MRMRKSIIVGADERGEGGQEIVVLELSLAQMADALEVMGRASALLEGAQGVQAVAAAMLGPDNPAAWRLLHGATSLGADIDNLGGTALCDVADAWAEVNQAFFDRLTRMAGILAAKAGPGATLPKAAA